MREHISRRGDHELEGVWTGLLQMSGVIECKLPLLEEVIANDKTVNAMEIELDEACNHLIVKRQPSASDMLRAGHGVHRQGHRTHRRPLE